MEPPPLARPNPSRVTGSAVVSVTSTTPQAISSRPSQVAPRLPTRATRRGMPTPLMMPPTAMEVPCSPATAWETSWSMRSSGSAADSPYR